MTEDMIRQVQAPELVNLPSVPDFVTTEQIPHLTDMDICGPCKDEDTVQTGSTQTDSHAHTRPIVHTNESQSDAGANGHLTNMRHVIKTCQTVPPFSIGTIEENSSITVTGKMMCINSNNGPRTTIGVWNIIAQPKSIRIRVWPREMCIRQWRHH